MGSISRSERCQRFIREFNKDAVMVFDMTDFASVVNNGLGMGDSTECVHFFVNLEHQSHQEKLMSELVIFDPEEQEDSSIGRVCELLKLEEDEVIVRFKKARLI